MRLVPFRLVPCALLIAAAACSSSTSSSSDAAVVSSCKADAECGADKPLCDTAAAACVTLPPGKEIGYRDGTAGSVTFTEVGSVGASAKPVDLAFHPDRKDELWVIDYGDDAIHVGSGIGSDAPSWKRYLDPAARHFAHKPPALAMGDATASFTDPRTWASCGDNDNGQNAQESDGTANLFVGPSLFTADLTVYAKRTSGGLGSHLDMLHESPFCRGIAHVAGNVYWVFNSYDRALDKYDFGKDHGPGNDDHSDGQVFRYAKGEVKGTDGTPSHLFFDPADKFLYVADTGNQRIARLDTNTEPAKNGPLARILEPLKAQGMMKAPALEEIVPAGVLEKPSGIELRGDLIYVTDAATSKFHVFDKTGKELRSLTTDLPADSLAGFTFGPDDKVYFVDRVSGRILRIDPK